MQSRDDADSQPYSCGEGDAVSLLSALWRLVRLRDREQREGFEELVALHMTQMGLSRRDAKELATQTLRAAIRASVEAGTSDLPVDTGNRLLALERSDPELRASMSWKRADGVRDEDILVWWNRPDVNRRLVEMG